MYFRLTSNLFCSWPGPLVCAATSQAVGLQMCTTVPVSITQVLETLTDVVPLPLIFPMLFLLRVPAADNRLWLYGVHTNLSNYTIYTQRPAYLVIYSTNIEGLLSLCSPGWPRAHRDPPTYVCLESAKIKGVWYHAGRCSFAYIPGSDAGQQIRALSVSLRCC